MEKDYSDVLQFFRENQEGFTVYVVERRFAVRRGNEFFKSYSGSKHYIRNEADMKKTINKILDYVQKSIPNILELIGLATKYPQKVGIPELLNVLLKLFFTNEHQAAGPEVIDPIIIEEESISPLYMSQLISLHKHSTLRPVIIIILKDNDFIRAKEILETCPHGLNVKLIRNSGETKIFKIINTGAADVEGFLDAFSRQCFSTCSQTQRSVLINNEWSNNAIANEYAPSILKVRTNLLFDEKTEALPIINDIIKSLESKNNNSILDEKLVEGFLCAVKLMNVYANDAPGSDLKDAYELAKDLDNELLLAHVYRYVDYFKNISRQEKIECLNKAKEIFDANKIEDHAIYCENNKLIQQFYSQNIKVRDFKKMHENAINNVPGLVGMSIICNNAGVAHLYTGNPNAAVDYFNKGLDYAQDRLVQYLGLKCNKLVALDYSLTKIEEKEIRATIGEIIGIFGKNQFSFITANYLLNLLTIVLRQIPEAYKAIINDYPIFDIINNAIKINELGSGSLQAQLSSMASKYSQFDTEKILKVKSPKSTISGIREFFVEDNKYSPTIFNAWL
ncbi:MAG: hypothetical protein IKL10_10850 [Clostridia bacterium]|nr:hypothetical protein [Bacilli bacterium]MBR3768718.1 hypothetical protein [Clostridia bacterium]